MNEIDALLQEDRSFPPSPAWRRDAVITDPGIYDRRRRFRGGRRSWDRHCVKDQERDTAIAHVQLSSM